MAPKTLVDALDQYPEFARKRGWRPIEGCLADGTPIVTGIENPRFGSVQLVANTGADGTPTYDQYVIAEGPADAQGKRAIASGAIIAPYFWNGSDLHVGLIENFRTVVLDPATGDSGYRSLELPRGFGKLAEAPAETAIRELGEETSTLAKAVHRLGHPQAGVNANTAFYATHIIAFAAEVDPTVRDHTRKDHKELILKCEFEPYNRVREFVGEGKILCGLSLAGLMLFDRFVEQRYGKR